MSNNGRFSHFKPWDAFFVVLLVSVHAAAYYTVGVLDMRYVLFCWVAYECLLLFTHLPYPFSRTLYRAAAWLYDNVNPTLYWGMEISSAMLAFAVAGAPFFVLLNSVTHGLFLSSAYKRGAISSARLYSDPKKTPRGNAIITFDNICHIVCLWSYLRYALRDPVSATYVTLGLLAVVGSLTAYYHRGEVRLAHFVHYLVVGLGQRGERGHGS